MEFLLILQSAYRAVLLPNGLTSFPRTRNKCYGYTGILYTVVLVLSSHRKIVGKSLIKNGLERGQLRLGSLSKYLPTNFAAKSIKWFKLL